MASLADNTGRYYTELYSGGDRGVYAGTATLDDVANTSVHLVVRSTGDSTPIRVRRNRAEISSVGQNTPSREVSTARWYAPCSQCLPSIPAAMDDYRVDGRALDEAEVAATGAM